jgi:hypothetical protein
MPRPLHVLSRDNPEFFDFVEEMGSASALNVVVGAGASMDAGLPGWRELLRTLLEEGIKRGGRRAGPPPADRVAYETLAEDLLSTSDALFAGTAARLLLGRDRDNAVWRALYEDHGYSVVPGRQLIALARLIFSFHGAVRVITFNWDDLLEIALREQQPTSIAPQTIRPRGPGTLARPGKTTIPVQHVHGYIPRDGPTRIAPIILDERDFALAQPVQITLDKLLADRNPTIFVGLSLTDPNLVSALYRRQATGRPAGPSFGLFVRDDEAVPELQRLWVGRLEQLGLQAVHLGSFAQVSQVLLEATYRRLRGNAYWERNRYGLRFERWHERVASRWPTSGPEFSSAHDEVHAALASELKHLTRRSDGLLRGAAPREHFGLELWAREPARQDFGVIRRLGTSSALLSEPWMVDERTLELGESVDHVAIDALEAGAIRVRDRHPEPRARWQALIGVPIETERDGIEGLLAGAVVLQSTVPRDESVLGPITTSPDLQRELTDRLTNLGGALLDLT